MSSIRPFPGGVVDPAWATRVVAPMQDTIDPATRAAILASNPWSYLHVTHGPEEGDDPAAVVEDNAAALRRLLAAGAFRRTPEPAMYVYRLRTGDHAQTGIVAEIRDTGFARGRILGHEAVSSERVSALVRHFARVPARSDLVALMHPTDADVGGVVTSCCNEPPLLEISAEDGLEQTVWRLADAEAMSTVRERLGGSTLYITDGHHRVAASIQLWEERGRPDDLGLLCVLFPEDQLRVLAFHRRITGPLEPSVTLERLRERAFVESTSGSCPRAGATELYLDGRWHRLIPHHRRPSPGRDGLDVTWLHEEILEPVFDIRAADDPRLTLVPQLTPLGELTARCDADLGALFVLRAPTLTQIVEVAERREVMPPKSTYFDPKPRSGLFIRLPSQPPR